MQTPQHYVAIFGGAVSGSEAAYQFSEQGIKVVVFDQAILPYGKIEDGLPKWHVKLRNKEERKINEKLSHPLVQFVPQCRLGEDVQLDELINDWGFSAILLAIGAEKDRPLPIDGIDDYIGKGLEYQNPFIHAYNHMHEPNYKGPAIETPDGAIIVGGGLASLDVAKVFMFETVHKALKERGHDVHLFDLDRSIARVLLDLGLTLDDLGIKGCTLYYRRRIKDMPLSPSPTDTPELLAKAQQVREKIFHNYQSKYLFNIKPLHMPVDKIIEGDRLAGLVFQKTEIVDGRVRPIEGALEEVRGPIVVSSIGSLPAPIPGVPLKGSVFDVAQEACCRLNGLPNVFALGNAVTGRGNILESMRHGRNVSQKILGQWLGSREDRFSGKLRATEDSVKG